MNLLHKTLSGTTTSTDMPCRTLTTLENPSRNMRCVRKPEKGMILSKVRKAMQITPSRSQRMMLLMTKRPDTMRKPKPEAHRGRGSAHHGERVAAHGALGDHAAGDDALYPANHPRRRRDRDRCATKKEGTHHGERVAAHGALGDHAAGDDARAGAKMCGRSFRVIFALCV